MKCAVSQENMLVMFLKKNAGADNNCTEKVSEKKKSPTLNCWMLEKKTTQNNQIKWDKLRKRPTNSI